MKSAPSGIRRLRRHFKVPPSDLFWNLVSRSSFTTTFSFFRVSTVIESCVTAADHSHDVSVVPMGKDQGGENEQ
jgi:hypothetical protein